MSSWYKLSFAQQALPLHTKTKLYRNNDYLYAVQNGTLDSLKYANGNWIRTPLLKTIDVRELYVADLLGQGQKILILKNDNGITFYQQNGNQLNTLLKTEDFEDNYFEDKYFVWDKAGSVVKFGHIYPDSTMVGIVRQRSANEIQIFAIMNDKLESHEYPIDMLETNLQIFGDTTSAKMALFDLSKSGQDYIVIHSKLGLNIYRINDELDIESLMNVPNSAKLDDSPGELFFPNLTGRPYRDIVVLNSTGLFVYQYTDESKNYEMISYDIAFSKLNGWQPEHTETVQFEDIDLDGRQDMIFTGPQEISVLSFDIANNHWRFLLENSELTVSQRHSNVMQVMPVNPSIAPHPLILAQYHNRLYSAKIVAIEEENDSQEVNELPDVSPSNSPVPLVIPPVSNSMRSKETTILLQDQFDYSLLFQTVGNTGKPDIRLPLVDLSTILSSLRFDLVYDGNNQVSDILGVGWTTSQSFIALVSPTIFPEDDIYYLVLEGSSYQLKFDPKLSTDQVYSFEASNNNFYPQARYYKNEEKWEINTKNFKQIYGGTAENGAISWSFKGKLVRNGHDQKFANRWNLMTTTGEHKMILKYAYETKDVSHTTENGKEIRQEVYLKSIDDSDGNKILFNYSDKNKDELQTDLNSEIVRTRFMSGYTVKTLSYQQIINFNYSVNKGKRFLNKIQQMNDISNQPAFQFSYAEMSNAHVMQKISIPNNTNIEFKYQLQPSVNAIQTCDVEKMHRVDYGTDYTIVSYLEKVGRVVVRIYTLDMSQELNSSSQSLPKFGKGLANLYTIYTFERFIAIILTYKNDKNSKELYLLRKDGTKWLSTPKLYKLDGKAIIRNGKDFITVANVSNAVIEVISWNEDVNDFEKIRPFYDFKINEKTLLFSVSGRFILAFDNRCLLIGYKNSRSEWVWQKHTDVPDVIGDINRTIDRFEIEGEVRDNLFDIFKNVAMKVSNNFLFLNRWQVDGMQIYSEIDVFGMDSSSKVVKRQKLKVLHENLQTFTKKVDDHNGTVYNISFSKENNKFKIIANSMEGEKMRQYEAAYPNSSKRGKRVRAYLDDLPKTFFKNAFVLDPEQYFADFIAQRIVCKNNKQFKFTDENWVEDARPSTIIPKQSEKFTYPIGKKFVLHKNDTTTSIKLHKQRNDANILGAYLSDLGVSFLNETLIRYPRYLAYGKTVKLFSTNGDIAKTFTLPENEQLTEFSSYRMLVTSIDTYKKTLIFRNQIDKDRLMNTVTQMTINFDRNMKRIMGYEYSGAATFGENILFTKISTIPSNKKAFSGWVEQTINIKESATEQRVYNSKGELVKTTKSNEKAAEKAHENDENNDDATEALETFLYSNSTLTDKSGKLKTAELFPHRLADVGYFGFEDYEVNGDASSKRWEFDESLVRKNDFSFTGHNFLRLTEGSLFGEFQLDNRIESYIASCWLRPQNTTFYLGESIPNVKAVVSASNASYSYVTTGEVKFQYADWFYVEAIIDLFAARENINYADKEGTGTASISSDFTTSIVVVPAVNATIDIDHIRFAPLENIFAVNVYDSKTFQLKEVIASSGLVERHFYDKQLTRIAIINDYGELKKFGTHTKASSVEPISQLKSQIEIQPEFGFYEHFAPVSFHNRWTIQSTAAWSISPGQLAHVTSSADTIQFNTNETAKTSHGIRFLYNLQSMDASIKFGNGLELLHKGNNLGKILFSSNERSIPADGELLIIAEGKRIFVWIDGGLYFEASAKKSSISLTIRGQTIISDLLIFFKPSVTVTYFNAFGDKLEEIRLESENVSMATGYRYDDLGRQTIVTRPVEISSSSQLKLAYHSNLVANTKAYDYSEFQYCDTPLSEKCAIGLPGREFSISGPFAKRFSYSPNDLFITNFYPLNENYHYKVEHNAGGVKIISVFDQRNNRVAWYKNAPKTTGLLTTYKYDESNRLVQTLPPAYHESVNTFHKINDPLNRNHQTEKEKAAQDLLGTNATYDNKGNILSKTSTDSGKTENIYNGNGLLKFVLQYSDRNIVNIIYYDYDHLDRLQSIGELNNVISKEQLNNFKMDSTNTKVYQKFSYNDFEKMPLQRAKIARTTTFDGEPCIEESLFNIDEENISKRVYVPSETNPDEASEIIAIDKIYRSGKLRQIQYPFENEGAQLNVAYQYDKFGKLVGIGVPSDEKRFVSFAYNSDSLVIGETHEPWSVNNFTRKFDYNSVAFLTELSDKFLTTHLKYTDGGYGSYGYNDGTITRTEFKASWHQYSDYGQLGLNEQSFVSESITPEISSACFYELKRMGYLDAHGRQVKIFYSNLEPELPILCRFGASGRHIQNVMGKNGFASEYGHSYDYGNYQELVKAKYFIGNEATISPLQPDTFAKEIRGITQTMSQDIWMKLSKSVYLIHDNSKIGSFHGHGKSGTSFINPLLHEDLKNMGNEYTMYGLPLENLLTAYFSKNQTSLSPNTLVKWNIGSDKKKSQQIATRIIAMLEEKDYVKNPLAREFTALLKPYQPFIHDIVGVLYEYFARGIGEAEFDIESYNIDANGNHKLFYTGFDRYEIAYHNNTNQISNVSVRTFALLPIDFPMQHDHRGNVVQAMHKGIERIDYNLITNRATNIHLTDGRTVELYYDAKGERRTKRVFDVMGRIVKEIRYMRDEFGRVLVERQSTYSRSDLLPNVLITAYIYGPKGLVGFVRRDQFYSVITDHEGSIRLVVKSGEVVAAYDYLPYGGLMREFGIDPDSHISYRYTGQEWDEETGLYNYHARFYDPSIGRFYQIDPHEQYFSPYKYAGNSPVSMVDPSGKVAFLIPAAMFFFGVVGGYVGGAVANEEWDIRKWDGTDRSTYIGVVGGALTGVFLPLGAYGSYAVLTGAGMSGVGATLTITVLGLSSSYVYMAAANNNEWNMSKWDYQSPDTWNALLNGFSAGSSIPAGIGGARSAYSKIATNWGKRLFVLGTIGAGTGSFVISGIRNDWDFTKPSMVVGVLQAFDDATNIPALFRSGFKSITKSVENMKNSKHILEASSVAAKLAYKGIVRTGASVLLTAFYNRGLDLSDPNTLFDIVRQMGIVNLHYAIAKKLKAKVVTKFEQLWKNRQYRKLKGDERYRDDGDSHVICKRAANSCSPIDEELSAKMDEGYEKFLTENRKNEDTSKHIRDEPLGKDNYDPGKLEALAQEIAELLVKWRLKLLQDVHSYDKNIGNENLPKILSDGDFKKIGDELDHPNDRKFQVHKAVSIAFGDKYAIGAFSGNNKGIGFVFLFAYGITKGNEYLYHYLDGFMLKDNSFMVKQKGTIEIKEGGIMRNVNILTVQAYSKLKTGLNNIKLNLDPYLNSVITETMHIKFQTREINAFNNFVTKLKSEDKRKFTEAIQNLVQKKTKLDKLYTETIQDLVVKDIKKKGRDKPLNVRSDMSAGENSAIERNMGNILFNNLKLLNLKSPEINSFIQQYKTSRKQFYIDHPKWVATNCAESHANTALGLINDRLKKLITFKEERVPPTKSKPKTTTKVVVFEPCDNCKEIYFTLYYDPPLSIKWSEMDTGKSAAGSYRQILPGKSPAGSFRQTNPSQSQAGPSRQTNPQPSQTGPSRQSNPVQSSPKAWKQTNPVQPQDKPRINPNPNPNPNPNKSGRRRRRRSVLIKPDRKEIKTKLVCISDKTPSAHKSSDSGRELHSFFNNIFNWVGQGAGLVNNWIDTSTNFKSETEGKTQTVDASRIDTNGTILLLDMLIRKFTARKHNTYDKRNDVSEHEARGFAINITAEFEEIVEHELSGLDIDFPTVQRDIFKKIINCEHNEIKALLISHVEKACKSVGCLHTGNVSNIVATLDEKLTLLLTPR